MAEPETETTIMASCVFQFKVDYEQSKQLPIDKAICSDIVSAGGHLWRIRCYPRGDAEDGKGEYISVYLEHMSKSRSVGAIFDIFIIGRDGKPPMWDISNVSRTLQTFEINGDKDQRDCWGWSQFIKETILEEDYLTGRHFTIVCTIMIIDDMPIVVPPPDIGTHLGRLLGHADGTDVSFVVDDETFRAHRAVLAARSPVLRVELFGSMSEAIMSSITLHDITPATFKVMLRFIYTDELPGEDEPTDSSVEMFQDLLAAADRYGLDRLKVICAQKLWEKVSVDPQVVNDECNAEEKRVQ
ncbi:BTB/POZ and MATH domain-containing protein 1-like [Aegilops tauschii subsp. strangulata]|uniref:BTB/POZ and MATH domain-containing protein 1-like n=1 Tax=Aegilops tauschii subsp. strangulata TaxID=200361 RepID=UPI00098B7690|nr:BTB/POZ and MATH domain-containing protein 1-like [Aegilops tauschii subsp. strangulata]